MRLILREATRNAHAVQVPDSMPRELRIPVAQEIRAGVQFFGEEALPDTLPQVKVRKFLLHRRENIFGQHLFQYEEV